MKTVAVMQPYFVPYAGYFRLIERADVFVLYDCVQFPRRGYVHRNQLPNAQGVFDWLTLPILKCERGTKICELAFAEDAEERLKTQLNSFPQISSESPHTNPLLAQLFDLQRTPNEYISQLLKLSADYLECDAEFMFSSALEIDPALKGQDRILAILKILGAERYVNAPGGRELYDAASFAEQGVELRFLEKFEGNYASVLHRFCTEPKDTIMSEIRL